MYPLNNKGGEYDDRTINGVLQIQGFRFRCGISEYLAQLLLNLHT